ncbi:ABC transporter ATP-binding protein [Nitrogeniibacter mangrovi]|uniref:ABC transporter ATP-binding protein n=1 Tax=Nitrogeniibacter mangrovi TaxID=2016596 RepID=A0A6C1B5Z7_9RHOO|nr:ABC transporter ATP-binding protein [Nitrogeniibacter mangrovi]QID18128.1 ABC transporter ATP-binding protein [Nitrogeniibacter mangrovi]
MTLLDVRQLTLGYDRHTVVDRLDVSLDEGAIGCLLGPSGCGKTTVLRAIAGFERVRGGEIVIGGQTVSAPGVHVPPEQRRIGMVFQDYALFPHLSIRDNIGFGLHAAAPAERRARVDAMLDLVGLGALAQRYPHELSGGQQQRVALARALAPAPRLLLMDEPFSNLDVELRERLSLEVRRILKATGTTAILVTHDQHEAFAVADLIGLMHAGHLQQWDTPYTLYHRPANRFVADFIGQGVLIPGRIIAGDRVHTALGTLRSGQPMQCGALGVCPPGADVDVLLRPDDVVHDDAGPQSARVLHKAFRGADILYTLALDDGTRLLSLVPSHHDHAIGERIGIRLVVEDVITFAQHTNEFRP